MNKPWTSELWRMAGLAVLAITVGTLIDNIFFSLFVVTALYLVWHLKHIYYLERWFRRNKDSKQVSNATGIWGEIYNNVYRLQNRNRQRKMKLSKMLSRFQKSTAAMPDATVVLNEYGEIEWINNAAKRNLGLNKKKDVGQRVDNLIRNADFSELLVKGDFDKVIELQSPVLPNMYLSIRLVPYAGNKILLIARDMTRLQKLERIRRDFVANVSHELRTPLTVIMGYLENLIGTDNISEETSQSVLKQMSQQSNRMCRIVDDLLMLSRLESDRAVKLVDVAIPAIIVSVLEEFKTLADVKKQTINASVDQQLWIMGNEQELYSTIANLVTNAIKYTPENGTIDLSWSQGEDGARLEVTDTGIGISPVHIPRLTERFYRIDKGRSRDQGGTGLGLAIVKHVLNRHEAQLEVKSVPGEGSTFAVIFPKRYIIKNNNKLKNNNNIAV